jgi:hypothetical protein
MFTNKLISADLLSGRLVLHLEKDPENLMKHAKLIQRTVEQRDVASLENFKRQVLDEFKNHQVPVALKKAVKNIVLNRPDLRFLTDNKFEPLKSQASLCNLKTL